MPFYFLLCVLIYFKNFHFKKDENDDLKTQNHETFKIAVLSDFFKKEGGETTEADSSYIIKSYFISIISFQ